MEIPISKLTDQDVQDSSGMYTPPDEDTKKILNKGRTMM